MAIYGLETSCKYNKIETFCKVSPEQQLQEQQEQLINLLIDRECGKKRKPQKLNLALLTSKSITFLTERTQF